MSKKPCSISLTPAGEDQPCTVIINGKLIVKDDSTFNKNITVKKNLTINNIIYNSEIIDETGQIISNEKSLSFINTGGFGELPNGLDDGTYKKVLKVDDTVKDWSPIGPNVDFTPSGSVIVESLAFDPITGEGPYVAGSFTEVGGNTGLPYFAYFDGTKWTSLKSGGDFFNILVRKVIFNPITGEGPYVGGDFIDIDGDNIRRITKWDKSIQSWDELNPIQSRKVFDIAFNPISGDGPYIVGDFVEFTPTLDSIAKWDEASTSWTSIKPSGDGVGVSGITINAIAFSPTGFGPYIGGEALDSIDGITGPIHFAYFDGTDWAILGNTGDFNDDINTIAFNPITGEGPYLGGRFTNVAGITGLDHLTKWDSGSSSWTSIGNTGDFDGFVRTIAFGPSGDGPYVGGSFNTPPGISIGGNFAVWDQTTSSWTSLNKNGDIITTGSVYDIQFSNDETVHISGNFERVAQNDIFKIAKFTNEYIVYYNGTGPSYDEFETLTNIGDCVSFLYNEDLGEWIKLNEV